MNEFFILFSSTQLHDDWITKIINRFSVYYISAKAFQNHYKTNSETPIAATAELSARYENTQQSSLLGVPISTWV